MEHLKEAAALYDACPYITLRLWKEGVHITYEQMHYIVAWSEIEQARLNPIIAAVDRLKRLREDHLAGNKDTP